MAQESSVVFSVRQLLDAEEERQKAAMAERELQLAREREQRRIALAAEAARIKEDEERARQEELRLDALRQTELVKARLVAEAAIERARQQTEAERARLLASRELTVRTAERQSPSRMWIAALTTLLCGAIAIWALVILPGQRRADQAYGQLQQQYARFTEQAGERESALTRQVQELRGEVKRVRLELAAAASAKQVAPPLIRHPARSQTAVPNTRKPACTCLASDPLCDCVK